MSVPAKPAAANQPPAAPTEITCTYCQATFPSKNKLFQHLRAQHDLDHQLELNAKSPLQSLTPAERTQASIAARGTYQNAAYDAYYRAQVQAGVLTPQEWEMASSYFRKPLPVAFRWLKDIDHQDVRYQFWKRLQNLVPPNSLEACPALSPKLAQVAAIPPRQWSEAAQQALMECQEVGVANRQEVCSMIPPLLLLQEGDILERGAILDLCAAPGSKSLQIMDSLKHHLVGDNTDALLVCNDANRNRLLTVARRSRRQPPQTQMSLCLNSSDGRYFPALRKWGGYKVKFDRVLADVPCSGDGTLRKLSSNDWKDWNVKAHLQLHRLQVRLLTRALESVGKGGRVVYSTCSLDPIEDEAVLTTAIARRGGPSVYRIVPIPPRLSKDATADFVHSPGATQWVVPHPQFGKMPKDQDRPIHETFQSVDQVPAGLRKKDLSPSMFPPKARTLENVRQIFQEKDIDVKLQQARFYGEILSDRDIALFEEMLPNCGRILPQHLDSGGFFCAIIERVAPAFYPVCYPLERTRREENNSQEKQSNDLYKYHGRVLTHVTSSKHMRELLAEDKQQGDEVCFEGQATLELALEWLKQHRSYQEGLSEHVLPAPSTTTDSGGDDDEEGQSAATPFKKAYVNDPSRSPLYTRLFPPPHPSLVEEFCDFFGFVTDPDQAQQAGVEVFPVHCLVAIGGGDDAVTVESCLDPQEAHTIVRREDALPTDAKVHRKRRFLQLVLVSEQARNLFKGGAKFNPMEVGLALCFVPIPGFCRDFGSSGASKETPTELDSSSRAAQSGRFGMMDEAAAFLGRCATKRVVALTQAQALDLLKTSNLEVPPKSGDLDGTRQQSPEHKRQKIQPPPLEAAKEWSLGAVIAAVPCDTTSSSLEQSTMFLPCVLKGDNSERRIVLLAEQRLTKSWKGLLEHLGNEDQS